MCRRQFRGGSTIGFSWPHVARSDLFFYSVLVRNRKTKDFYSLTSCDVYSTETQNRTVKAVLKTYETGFRYLLRKYSEYEAGELYMFDV